VVALAQIKGAGSPIRAVKFRAETGFFIEIRSTEDCPFPVKTPLLNDRPRFESSRQRFNWRGRGNRPDCRNVQDVSIPQICSAGQFRHNASSAVIFCEYIALMMFKLESEPILSFLFDPVY
jgi:hypothetical protein